MVIASLSYVVHGVAHDISLLTCSQALISLTYILMFSIIILTFDSLTCIPVGELSLFTRHLALLNKLRSLILVCHDLLAMVHLGRVLILGALPSFLVTLALAAGSTSLASAIGAPNPVTAFPSTVDGTNRRQLALARLLRV